MNILRKILGIGRRLVQVDRPARVVVRLGAGLGQSPVRQVVGSNGPVPISQPPVPFPSGQLRRVVRIRAKALYVNKWEEKRWVRRSGLLRGGIPALEYSGFYQTAGGRKWPGFIVETVHGVEPFIFKPPLEDIETYTTHKPCFRPRGKEMYFVHTADTPRSVDEVIVNIEVFLNELEQKAGWPKLVVSPVVRVTARAGRPE